MKISGKKESKITTMHLDQQENQMSNQCESCHQVYLRILKEQPEQKRIIFNYALSQLK
jgi:hypothetical protein